MNYNFRMEYQKGSTNLVADAFSRLPRQDTKGGTLFEEDVVALIATPFVT